MKKLLLIPLVLLAFSLNLNLALAGAMEKQMQDSEDRAKAAIIQTLDRYIDAAVKGDSKVAEPAFAPLATMSYAEKGKLVTVPIKELFAYYDKTGPHQASYKITSMTISGDVACVSIDSKFGQTSFDDMFTLVRDGDQWKIVSKVYHIK